MFVLILVSMVMSHAPVDLFALQKPGLNYFNFIVLLSRRRLDAVLHLKVAIISLSTSRCCFNLISTSKQGRMPKG